MKPSADDPRLTAYALGELAEPDRAAMEQALRDAPERRRVVEEIRDAATLLANELAAEPCPQLDRNQQQAVLAAFDKMATTERGLPGWIAWFWWRPAAVLGAAAGLVLILVLQDSLKRPPPQPPATTAGNPTSALPGTNGELVLTSPSRLKAELWPASPAVPVQPAVTSQGQVVQTIKPAPTVSPVSAPRPAIGATSRPPVIAIQPVANVNKATIAPGTPLAPPPAPSVAQMREATGPVLALAPLALILPMPSFKGTPEDLPKGPNIEPFSDKPRATFLAPTGVKNLALNRAVTSSDKNPITGSLAQITDGNKEAIDDAVVELHKNVQWVQLDLDRACNIYAIVIWHDHRSAQIFRCVVVQAADDPDFTQHVRTLFNNDLENVAGLGMGQDKQYFETNQGKLIDANGVKARYLRFYSKGSNASALNCYTEIEVYGLPAE